MGGNLGFLVLWILCIWAMENALWNLCCLFRWASKAYQAMPLRGRPLSLGMYMSRAMTRTSTGWLPLHQHSGISDFVVSNSKCIVSHSELLINMRVIVTGLTIKAIPLVPCTSVLFTGMRGLLSWSWLLGLAPILMVRRWESVASI